MVDSAPNECDLKAEGYRLSAIDYRPNKKRRPPHSKERESRLSHELPGVRGLAPAVLLPVATAWTDASAVGRLGAPASIPNRSGHDLVVRSCGRCRSIESLTDSLHCTPRRHVGVGETTRLASPTHEK